MSDRSAEASIRGYNYQFLHTIKDILENDSDTYENTIEGIEDLDITKENSTELIQYKYHEEQSYQNSKVAKPIALMFKHFLQNQSNNIKYKLFIFLNTVQLPELTIEKITEILKIKESRKILSNTDTELTYQDIDNYNAEINDFHRKLSWMLSQKYDELENSIILMFENNMGLSIEEAKIIYLTNAIKIINDLAIEPDMNSRKITKRDLLAKLSSQKNILFSTYLLRTKDFTYLKRTIKNQKRALNIKKNSSTHIIVINNIRRENINSLIIDLIRKFCYKGNKIDFKPLVFIVNSSILEEYRNFKKSLYMDIIEQNIYINDGYEDYKLNINVFNQKPLIEKNQAGKIKRTSFNLKLINKSFFDENTTDIKFANPSLFVLDSTEPIIFNSTDKQFYLNKLSNTQILELIGE